MTWQRNKIQPILETSMFSDRLFSFYILGGFSMIAIVDYDAGNLKSVEKALQYIGQKAVITSISAAALPTSIWHRPTRCWAI